MKIYMNSYDYPFFPFHSLFLHVSHSYILVPTRLVYGVSLHETVNLNCDVEALPSKVSFQWRFQGTQDLASFNQINDTRLEPEKLIHSLIQSIDAHPSSLSLFVFLIFSLSISLFLFSLTHKFHWNSFLPSFHSVQS